MDFMSIETIAEAHSSAGEVIARCAYSRGDGPSSKSSRECIYRKELDMETLVWTRGRAFPLSRSGKPPEMPTMRLAADCGAI